MSKSCMPVPAANSMHGCLQPDHLLLLSRMQLAAGVPAVAAVTPTQQRTGAATTGGSLSRITVPGCYDGRQGIAPRPSKKAAPAAPSCEAPAWSP